MRKEHETRGAIGIADPNSALQALKASVLGLSPIDRPASGAQLRRRLQSALNGSDPGLESCALGRRLAEFAAASVVHAFEYRGRHIVIEPVTGTQFTTSVEHLCL